MAYWLFKSEPETWSWDEQVRRGAKGEGWNGVRNHQAANNMKAMKTGDRAFFYHSGDEKRSVGIVVVIREYHPDPTDESGRFGMVTVRAVEPVPRPVTLAEVKADPRLDGIALKTHSRLSVMPIEPAHWAYICKLGGLRE
jgi:predicted RNA-binding protein with PUA-like domain